MPITLASQPAPVGDLLTPYAPVKYELTATTAFTNPPVVYATLFINGVQAGEPYIQPHYQNLAGTYYFRFDIAERLRDQLNNTDTFLQGANTNTLPAADAANIGFARKCEFYVVFELYEASGAVGQLFPSGLTQTSTTLYAINIAANIGITLTDIENLGSVLPFNFMTNEPKIKAIPLASDEYLSFWDTGATRRGIRFRSYDSAGALVATQYFDIGQANNSVKRVRRINVGTVAAATILGSLTGVSFYRIAIVDDITALPPMAISEERTYHIDRSTCPSIALHFLNPYGADDTMRFGEYAKQSETERQNYARNYSAYPVSNARGLTTLSSIQRENYTLTAIAVPNEELAWYAEAANSVEAYIEFPTVAPFTAVQINEVDVEGESTEEETRDVELSITVALPKISHSN